MASPDPASSRGAAGSAPARLRRGAAAAPRVRDARARAARPARRPDASNEALDGVRRRPEAPAQGAGGVPRRERSRSCPKTSTCRPQQTLGVERVLQRAAIHVVSAEQEVIDGSAVLVQMFREDESLRGLPARAARASRGSTSSLHLARHRARTAAERRPSGESSASGEGEDDEDGDAAPRTRSRPSPPTSSPRPPTGSIDPLIGRATGARAHDPGAVPAAQEQPALRRRARRRQDRHRRGPGAAHPRGQGARRAQGRARSTRSTWARCSPAPSSAASSRSGSRA